MRRKFLLGCFFIMGLFVCESSINAQGISGFTQTGSHDVKEVVKAYTSPMLRAIGNNFNAGWYTTAEPLKPFRFDIRMIPSISTIPQYDRFFYMSNLNLNHLGLAEGDKLPTMFGQSGTHKLTLDYDEGNTQINASGLVDLPTTGFNIWPGISPQINIGLMKGTELMIRYLPPVKISFSEQILNSTLESNYFGMGVKHDVGQWIPGFKMLPISVSIGSAFFTAKADLLGPFLTMEDVNGMIEEGINTDYEVDADSQRASLATNGYRFDILVSKKIAILSFYAGLGYSTSKTSFDLFGEYPFVKPVENNKWDPDSIIDPINMEVKTSQLEISGGMRFKLAIFSLGIGGAYSPNGYSTATLSLGVGYFN
ncbi:MAG: hypothetical protein JEZ03_11020 [Bacteroidales bacterium]|nr:hypothetical protein [Bacteroidales bacterium]